MSVNIMYYKPHCPYSIRAKQLLQYHKINLQLIDVSNNIDWKNVFFQEHGVKVLTVPQIIINGSYIGGYSDLDKYLNNDGYGVIETFDGTVNNTECILF